MPLPLQGLRVLDLSRALAGPYCTMILADLGADVVKVEPSPKGEMIRSWGPFADGISVYYLSVHRNKRSLVLDFRKPEGIALIAELAAKSDILVENFKPGTMEDMGLGYDTLKQTNPRLIYANITGFGRDGPYGDWPGVDQIAQGMSGFMSITGTQESGPVRVGLPVGDVCAGMWTALGIQAAVIERMASGKGQRVETSLLAGLVGMLNVQGQRQLTLGDTPKRIGNDHPVICPYGAFEAKDGPFNMAALTDDMWRKLCALTGLDELATNPEFKDNTARMRNRDEIKRRLNAVFASRTRLEWTKDLVKLGLPAGPIYDMADVFEDAQVKHWGMVETVAHPKLGDIKLMSNPLRLDSIGKETVRTAPPLLGEHTAAVLRDFGFNDAQVDDLIGKSIVQTGEAQ
ncbi:MAG: CoA transferase [Alphaproteobacteria bacterium 64-6]|uniref:CaiB/BaiF CoA transferase family protein n=1 Tax=Hyphomicrobium sp. CS1BSMeth3 TaxID=1892844 RepID=UPI0009308169|nr:CaiB/BaiF CoA-transferase family protein [Hyphomicrobium sp. CS1BSMeth3]MBN9265634.1 CoA transferase [Hyphomicrobium sp.]OJU28561.1 MAG: CoA transferase [Alphaproteobacteria bacterium 64-6]